MFGDNIVEHNARHQSLLILIYSEGNVYAQMNIVYPFVLSFSIFKEPLLFSPHILYTF